MTNDMLEEQIVQATPLRRWVKPSEIGGLAGLLVSDAAALITGQFLIAGKPFCDILLLCGCLSLSRNADPLLVLQMEVHSLAELNTLAETLSRHQTCSTSVM